MPLRVGDRVIRVGDRLGLHCEEILEVRNAGYTWRYVASGQTLADSNAECHRSEATDDPLFERGWILTPARAAP